LTGFGAKNFRLFGKLFFEKALWPERDKLKLRKDLRKQLATRSNNTRSYRTSIFNASNLRNRKEIGGLRDLE